jgi:hypothetical protein
LTDVYLYQTDDGGTINVTNGTTQMTDGPESAVYLALFGGNDSDPGEADTTLEWWGNKIETDTEKHYRSRTQYLLRSLPAIPANLPRVKSAVTQDLADLVSTEVLVDPAISVTIPRLNTVRIVVDSPVGPLVIISPWEAVS